jgi:hypothetical protein
MLRVLNRPGAIVRTPRTWHYRFLPWVGAMAARGWIPPPVPGVGQLVAAAVLAAPIWYLDALPRGHPAALPHGRARVPTEQPPSGG